MKEKVYAILNSLFENGRIRSIRPNEKRPYGFHFYRAMEQAVKLDTAA